MLSTNIFQAASQGDTTRIRELVAAGGNVNEKAFLTPLHAAAQAGQTESVRVLLELGASVDAVDEFQRTPLLQAVKEKGNPEVFRLLVAAGANVKAKDRYDTILMAGVKYGTPNNVLAFLDYKDVAEDPATGKVLASNDLFFYRIAEKGHLPLLNRLLGYREVQENVKALYEMLKHAKQFDQKGVADRLLEIDAIRAMSEKDSEVLSEVSEISSESPSKRFVKK